MSNHIIEAKNLHFSYPDGTSALNDVSFKVSQGESIALIGENGAGKSTLSMHLNGTLFPTAGEISVAGVKVSEKNLPKIRRLIGMVFQNSDDQLFMPSIKEDVAFGPINLGLTASEVERKTLDALERVGLTQIGERPPHHLSGGEKRRAAIATVLSMDPEVIVMDEPTSSLDPKSRSSLIELLRSISHTKILASHDLDMIMRICDRTIILLAGRIEADGPTKEILRNKALLNHCSLEQPLSMRSCPLCSTNIGC